MHTFTAKSNRFTHVEEEAAHIQVEHRPTDGLLPVSSLAVPLGGSLAISTYFRSIQTSISIAEKKRNLNFHLSLNSDFY